MAYSQGQGASTAWYAVCLFYLYPRSPWSKAQLDFRQDYSDKDKDEDNEQSGSQFPHAYGLFWVLDCVDIGGARVQRQDTFFVCVSQRRLKLMIPPIYLHLHWRSNISILKLRDVNWLNIVSVLQYTKSLVYAPKYALRYYNFGFGGLDYGSVC